MDMNIIGICGKAGVGKSTSAKFLVEGRGFVEINLADEIKRVAKRWYGFTDDQLYGPSASRMIPNARPPHLVPRRVLQQLGTEVGRLIYADTWIDFCLASAEKALKKVRGVVVGDVRFPNEALAIQRAGGMILKINRTVPGVVDGHLSETSVDDVIEDVLIDNVGTLEELKEQVLACVVEAS